MADNKKILDLPNGIPLLTDTSVFADLGGTFGYTFTQLLNLLQANLSVGSVITFGTSIPSNSVGLDGDVYIKTDTQEFAQRISGVWTVVYTVAAGVADGTNIFGSGVPSSDTGKNGDTYIDTATGIFYQKSSGSWTQVFSMATGPAGPRGNSVLNGTGAPDNTVGTNGDFYIDTDAELIYGPKASGVWPESGVSIAGISGNTILNGAANPTNDQGNNGDFYLNTNTYFLFGPKASGVWPAGISLIGGAPVPFVLDFSQGAPNPIFIDWTSYSAVYGNIPTVIVLTRNKTAISLLGTITPGSGYTNGTYNNIALTGGGGTDAKANITISGGVVTSIRLISGGTGYSVSDTLSASLPGGSGFSIPVADIGNNYSVSQLAPQAILDSTNTTVQTISIDDPDPSDSTILADEVRICFKQ